MRLGGSRGGGGGAGVRTPPLKNHNTIGFPSNTGLGPLIISRLPSQHSMLDHQRYDSETPFVGGPMLARLWWYLDRLSPRQLRKKRCQSRSPSPKKQENIPRVENYFENTIHM